tara:strand:+ start:1760 stop:2749 length:990 start_codon:yes stop_codon:yes gene_type:complete
MGYYTGQTIAFSHKGGFWKSRYSFTPTCYASVDNEFISTNAKHPNAELPVADRNFWMHNSSMTHNAFYGKLHSSNITVVSNQDPSAIKIFKALSLESNSNSWTGMSSTNINPLGSPQNDLQMGTITGFSSREGNQYSELPRDVTNSDSHIDFACMVSEIITAESELTVDSDHTVWEVEAEVPNVSINGGVGSVALFREGDVFKYFNLMGGIFEYTDFATAIQNSAVHVHAYDAADNVIIFGGATPASGFVNQNSIAQSLNLTLGLYVVSNPDINGDPMRGHYLYLNLINQSVSPVETYAINVDFENTKLDGSKTAVKKPPAKKASSRSK